MALKRLRNPLAFGVSLVLLTTAAALGLNLPGDEPADLHEGGDGVRLRGDLVPFSVPGGDDWAPVRTHLHNETFLMHSDADEVVLVTGPASAAGEDRIVRGTVVYLGPHPGDPARTLAVVEAESVRAGLW